MTDRIQELKNKYKTLRNQTKALKTFSSERNFDSEVLAEMEFRKMSHTPTNFVAAAELVYKMCRHTMLIMEELHAIEVRDNENL